VLSNEKCEPIQIKMYLVMKRNHNLLKVLKGFIIVGACCILVLCILFSHCLNVLTS